eukprot:m.227076 g.227076  ORF g.227076 m.227076 type:complete len:205 (+) comp13867_c0_seq20:3951-4565(+)
MICMLLLFFSVAVEQTASLNYRWSALEVLRDNVFSFESDIWSFGVFMYEVFASSEPYSELGRDVDLVDFLLTGSRLPNPFNTDDKIHNCMLRCWMAAEERRPLLKNLIQCFTTLEEIARIEIAKNSLIGDAVLFSHFPVLDLLTPVEKDALRRTSASNGKSTVVHACHHHQLIHASEYFISSRTQNDKALLTTKNHFHTFNYKH